MKRFAAVLILSLALPAASAPAGELVLARVGGEPITSDQLAREFGERHSGHAKFLLGSAEIHRFLEQVVDTRLLVQEAYRLELDREPEITAAVEEFLARAAADRLVAEEVDSQVQVSDDEVRGVWERELGEVRDVLEIVVASRAEAEEVARRLARGDELEAVAREVSVARSRLRGGRLPPVGWGARDPDWERTVFALEPGQISEPFLGAEGWSIVRLLEVREVERPELDKVQGKIRALLEKRELDARRAELGALLWSKYSARLAPELDLRPSALASLAASAPQTLLASWKDGSLRIGTFVEGLDLDQVVARDDAEALVQDLLRRTVTGLLARLEAKARGLDARPELQARSIEVREILMQGALLADHLLRGVEVTDDEVRAWFEGHGEDFRVPERRRTAHIVVGSREEAEGIRARLLRGEDFGQLARELSKDAASARGGGDLGWVSVGEIPEELAGIRELPVGGVSEPLETHYGWHVIRVTDLEPERGRAYAEVERELRAWLFEREKTERRRYWIDRLREATEIEIDEEAIAAFAAQVGAGSGE